MIGTTPDGYAADIAAIISQASPRSRLSRLARFSLEYREHPSTMNRTNFYRAFLRWLCLKIEEQCGDIEGLAVAFSRDQQTEFAHWLCKHSYSSLVPAWALEVERELFLSDLQIATELLAQTTSFRAVMNACRPTLKLQKVALPRQ